MKFNSGAEYNIKRVADNLGFDKTQRDALRVMNLGTDTPEAVITKGLLAYFTKLRLAIEDGYADRKMLLKGILRHQDKHNRLPNPAEMMQYGYMAEAAQNLNVYQPPQFPKINLAALIAHL